MKSLLTATLVILGLGSPIAQAQRVPKLLSLTLPRHELAVPVETAKSATARDEAEQLSHRHQKAKYVHEVQLPTKSTHNYVSAAVSTK